MAEVSFPRGKIDKPNLKRRNTANFGATVPMSAKELSKKSKLSKKEIRDHKRQKTAEMASELQAQNAKLLNIHSLEVGMLIMGCVRTVSKEYLLISLPGRITGRVAANDISDVYTKERSNATAQHLHNLFSIGDLVCCRVVSKSLNGVDYFVNLSINPKVVNSHLRSQQICQGFALIGSVKTIEDHGYTIDSGIGNSSAFLSLKNTKRKTAHLGQLIVGFVTEILSAKEQPTFVLKETHFTTSKLLELTVPNLDLLLPGSVVEFTVTDHIEDGLKGHLFEGLFENVYINKQQLSDASQKINAYGIGDTYPARILYVTNLTKHIHCTLHIEQVKTNEELAEILGTVIKDAKVMQTTKYCVYFQWKTDKGEVQQGVMSVTGPLETNMDKYPLKSKHEIEILDYFLLDHLFKVGPVTEDMWKRVNNVRTMEIGNVVDGKVTMALNLGGYGLKIGRVFGYCHEIDLKPNVFYKKDDKVTGKIIAIDYRRNTVQVTNRAEYFTPYAELLATAEDAKCGRIFTGVIFKELPKLFLIRFANNVRAALAKDSVQDENVNKKLKVGRIFEFKVESVTDNGRIRVVVATDEEKRAALVSVGNDLSKLDSKNKINKFFSTEMQAIVHQTGDQNLTIEIPHLSMRGTIGRMFLSNFSDLCTLKMQLYEPSDKVDCVCVGAQLFSVRDLDYFRVNPNKVFGHTFEGEVLKSWIVKVTAPTMELFCPVKDVKVQLKTTLKNVLRRPKFEAKSLGDDLDVDSLAIDQVIYCRIDRKHPENKSLAVSANLYDVWTGTEATSVDLAAKYFEELKLIQQTLVGRQDPIADLALGDIVEGEITEFIDQTPNRVLLKLCNGEVDGVIGNCGTLSEEEIGSTLKCVVVFVDYAQKLVHLTADKKICKHIRRHQKSENSANEETTEEFHTSQLLFSNSDIMVFYSNSIVTACPLIVVPTRFHFNDFYQRVRRFADDIDSHQIKIVKSTNGLNFGMFEKALEFCKYVQKKITKIRGELKGDVEEAAPTYMGPLNPNKRKLEETNGEVKKKKKAKVEKTVDYEKKSNGLEKRKKPKAKKLPKLDQLDGASDFIRLSKVTNKAKQSKKMPGAENFWSAPETTVKRKRGESSSDEDEQMKESTSDKKVKLTKQERLKLVKVEEERLRKIENELADATTTPHSPEQFDRILLGSPNNSLMWIKWMCYHVEAAELDKARNVAHRALKTINFREEQELLNVWLALLNLEIRYGNEGTWTLVLEEALVRNNPFKVYTKAVEILLSVDMRDDLEGILQKMLKKFKPLPDMWVTVATAYFELGLTEKVKQLLTKALVCLPIKDHIQTIIRFAFLNSKYNQKEQACILFEQVVTSYPKRVDIWSQYIDFLVKDGSIDAARQVLDRAVSQKLPMKKMKTLFTKFVQFEEKFGDANRVHQVKKLAADYVKRLTTQNEDE